MRLKARNNKSQGFTIRYYFYTQNQIKITGSRTTSKTRGPISQGPKNLTRNNKPQGFTTRYYFCTQNQIKRTGSRTTNKNPKTNFTRPKDLTLKKPQGCNYKVQFLLKEPPLFFFSFYFYFLFLVCSQWREPQGFTYKAQLSHNNHYKAQFFFLTWNHF